MWANGRGGPYYLGRYIHAYLCCDVSTRLHSYRRKHDAQCQCVTPVGQVRSVETSWAFCTFLVHSHPPPPPHPLRPPPYYLQTSPSVRSGWRRCPCGPAINWSSCLSSHFHWLMQAPVLSVRWMQMGCKTCVNVCHRGDLDRDSTCDLTYFVRFVLFLDTSWRTHKTFHSVMNTGNSQY